MRMRLVYSLMLGAGALFLCNLAHAIEFKSVADEIAVLYDAPSEQSTKRLILTRGYLAAKRTVMVSEATTEARDSPGDSTPVIFRAEKGVVLDFLEVSGGWAKVRHRSGVVGFIRLRDLWGV